MDAAKLANFAESEISNAIGEAMNQVYKGTSETEKNEKTHLKKHIKILTTNPMNG